MAAKIFRINYKSDFILTMNSEAGWTIPFCIKFWTSIPMRAYYVGFDGTTYTHCAYDPAEPTKLLVQFDDHHLPIGNLHFQIAYHFTVEDFPNNTEDEVFNATAITTEIDGETYQVMLDFIGETAPGIDFNMPSVGVTSVNGKIGAVTLNAQDVGAQPTIEDLATIRSGAAAGATAVQPAALQEGLATKQDVISDLSTIRSGAAAGATAVQPAAITPIQTALQTIEAVIPSAATSQNQLADKNFVNSSISTNTANFVGTYNSLAELQAVQNPTNNDYGFVIETDAQGNEYYDRYKYVAASQQWLFEYKVESTPFTAEQWAAIQSGITSALVTKLNALPTNAELQQTLDGKANTSDIPTALSQLSQDSTHRVVTDAEKSTWNGQVVEYNILDYAGNTLNERWDAMRQSFGAWVYKRILIPHPREGCSACIKVGNDWKWKVSAPLVFTDKCNCSYIEVYGELYVIASVSQVLLFDDIYKPENIYFTNGIVIRGDRNNGKTIGCAIEIRSGARINFSGQVIINDCDYGIIVGGESQSAAAYASFDLVQVSFFDTNAIYVCGDAFPTGITANSISVSCAQSEGLDAIKIEGSVIPLTINNISYATDIEKDGYLAYSANSIVLIKGSTTKDTHAFRFGTIYGTESTYGLYVDGKQGTHIYDIVVDYVGIANTTGIAVYARYCPNLNIRAIKGNNTIDIASCTPSNIFHGTYKSGDSVDIFAGLTGTINIDSTTSFLNTPTITNKNLGAITIVKAAYGKHVYINDGDENILLDGQMYVPTVSSLPTPAWNIRGKMFRINNDSGQDVIAVCIRYGGNAYRWFDLVAGAVI